MFGLNNFVKRIIPKFKFSNIIKTSAFKNFCTLKPQQTKEKNFFVAMNNLRDNCGARIKKRRLGRGNGNGKGKTSGRGHKGYTARTSEPHRHFEGGQTPLSRRLPKHGFRNKYRHLRFAEINIEKIIYLIIKGRIDAAQPINLQTILLSGGCSKIKTGVKLLSRGSELLDKVPPLHFVVNAASQKAIDDVKKHGGSITCEYTTKLTTLFRTKPWKFYRELLDPIPRFKAVKNLLAAEEKGAMYFFYFKFNYSVKFEKPRWMDGIDLKKRSYFFNKRVNKMKNAHLLPVYPPRIEPHMSDETIRIRRPLIWRKINFDIKH